MMNVLGPDSGTSACAAGSCVRRGYIRIGAVVDIEQRSLSAFEHHSFAGVDLAVKQQTGAANERPKPFTVAGVSVMDLIEIEGLLFENRLEIDIFLFNIMAQFVSKRVLFEQIDKADTDSRYFVFVRRTDAPAGSANFSLASEPFPGQINGLVVRHDEMRFFADTQQRIIKQMPLGLESVNLLDQNLRINHHAVADHAQLIWMQRPGRNEMQYGLFAVHHQGVTGVVAALEADDDIGVAGKKIDDFAFTFVAPLGSDDCYVGH